MKNQFNEDIDIFLDFEVFGETLRIDEKEYIGVLEYGNKEYSDEDILAEAVAVTIFLRAEEELIKYKNGKAIEVNNEVYVVNSSYEENGMFILKLSDRQGY